MGQFVGVNTRVCTHLPLGDRIFIHQKQAIAIRDEAGVFHGPSSKIGHRDQIEFLVGIIGAEVGLLNGQNGPCFP